MEYKEFKKILEDSNLTVKDFSNLSELSYRTCISWSIKDRKVPNWVKPFINFYLESQECKKHKEAIQTLIGGLNK